VCTMVLRNFVVWFAFIEFALRLYFSFSFVCGVDRSIGSGDFWIHLYFFLFFLSFAYLFIPVPNDAELAFSAAWSC